MSAIQRSEQEWITLLGKHARSGLSQTAFCQQHNLARSSFSTQKKRLSHHLLHSSAPSSAFITATPPASITIPNSSHSTSEPEATLLLRYQQLELQLPTTISSTWLAQLLRGLAS
jgi:hypothetical protein